jgi:CRISPR-associated protein (TIGR02710 family)
MISKQEFETKWRELNSTDTISFCMDNFESLSSFFHENTDENDTNRKPVFERPVDVLITAIGTYDPMPLAYLYRYINPEKIIILQTDKAAECLKKLLDMQIINTQKMDIIPVKKMDAVHIYQLLKNRLGINPPETMVFDVTAGTSMMSVALAKMALVLNAQLTWIVSDMEKGRLLPWTSRLEIIQDPLMVWGDYEIRQIQGMFRNHQYAMCVQYLEDMLKRIPPYNDVYFLMETRKKFCEMFAAWNQLDLKCAEERCGEILQILERVQHDHNFDVQDLKNKHDVLLALKDVTQGKGLTNLHDEKVVRYLLAYLFHTAERRSETRDYMSSVLYLYRTLEMIAQFRLIRQDLSPNAPDDYLVLDNSYSDINWRDRYRETCKALKHNCELPPKIGMLQGFQILSAIKDEIMDGDQINVRRIQKSVEPRNQMIMEHGFDVVDEQKYRKFRDFVELMLKRLFKLQNWKWDQTLVKIVFPVSLP